VLPTPNRDRQGAGGPASRYNEEQSNSIFQERTLADEKLFKAEYLGSGTFAISKPKRKKIKVRQSQLKNPQRGSRK
jgi:hypothetical protein